ncbi:MAG: LLM class flavin-dependent oxidoreductase [Planctomycetes bacterium]|nr:LLM class flavin-dependent oxidoreductase [Planctomycetota bacterium]
MRYGYWMPVFGGWLRNVDDENMTPTWEYSKRLAIRSEQIGYSLSLVAELNLNDIKGEEAPSLDAWSTAAALMAVTSKLELMVAVRPTFHSPALLAKQAANIDNIGGPGRLSLNVVSSWWKDEATKYGVQFEQHDDRYARTAEWLSVVDGVWKQDHFTFEGKYYKVHDNVLQPKPVSRPRPVIYAGGRREGFGLGPMIYGVAGYSIVRNTDAEAKAELARITDVKQSKAGYNNYQQWLAGTQLEQRVSLEDYSVSNRGLRAGLVGTPGQVLDQVKRFEAVGVNLLLLQCSPQLEEMERFADQVIQPSK